MFHNLIESGSHRQDIKRRSSFFIGTLGLYTVLLLIAGVSSIYAYQVRLAEPDLDLVMIMRFPPTPPTVKAPERSAPLPAGGGGSRQARAAVRKDIAIHHPNLEKRAVADKGTPEVTPRMLVQLGDENATPLHIGLPHTNAPGTGLNRGGRGHQAQPLVQLSPSDEAPELVIKKVAPTPQAVPRQTRLTSSILSGKAIYKPIPAYPQIAKIAGAHGPVTVQIVVDEHGRVVSAQATSGHPLLRPAAVQAAHQARFTPTLLSDQPVKVSGVITYHFMLR